LLPAAASATPIPPDTVIDPYPAFTNDTTPSFTVSTPGEVGPEQFVFYECTMDGFNPGVPCGPEYRQNSETPLAEGEHVFKVNSVVQNFDPCCTNSPDPTPAEAHFTVDTTPPDTAITGGPANGSTPADPNVSFAFSANEPVQAMTCTFDAGDPFACTNGSYSTGALKRGPHTFSVFATDRAGNSDTSPASVAFSTPRIPKVPATCRGLDVTIRGTLGDDRIDGTPERDVISTSTGNDRISGGDGNDVICSGAGRDKVKAGGGDDRIFAGTGRDDVAGEGGDDSAQGGLGRDRCSAEKTDGCES
jgi:Ca2+-binding RTX toxin-like protein